MPEEGEILRPPELPAKTGRFRKWYFKSEPALIGGAWYLAIQFLHLVLTQAGLNLDQTHWRVAGGGMAAVSFLVSTAHVSTVAFRLAGLNFLLTARMISKTEYQRMRSAVVKAYIDRVKG